MLGFFLFGGFPAFGCAAAELAVRLAAMERLSLAAWQEITLRLLVRSGGLCEARTPACLAGADGRFTASTPVSRHHRLPRGAGGLNGPENLLLVCGDGVAGCHGHIEHNRAYAYGRGLLVRRGEDPAAVPLMLVSGRLVLLDPLGSFYVEIGWWAV